MTPTTPIRGEQPQIDWPTIAIGDQTLVVRWSLFAQWTLSKRKVSLKNITAKLRNMEPDVVDLMIECFAAAVGENFSSRGFSVPTAEYWAMEISKQPNSMELFKACGAAVWTAIAKMGPADPPAPQDAVPTTGEVTEVIESAKTVN